jgi:putative SOS response-associated peptidase YedK
VSTSALARPPRYTLAPVQMVPAVHGSHGRLQFVPMHWGLIPSWAKDAAIGTRMINAPAETVREPEA